jgi:hypothetical protein
MSNNSIIDKIELGCMANGSDRDINQSAISAFTWEV